MDERPVVKNQTKPAVAAGLAGNTIWGMGYYFMSLAMRFSSPAVMLFWRFLLAFIILTVCKIIRGIKIDFRGKNIKRLLIFVAIEPVCFFLESYSVVYTNATFSGMVMAVAPLAAILFAAIFLKEYPTGLQMIFSILPIAGVIMITVAGKSLGVITPLGLACCIGEVMASGIYKTANRGASTEFSAFERTYFLITACAITYAVYAAIETGLDFDLLIAPVLNPGFVLPVVLMALCNSIIANYMVNYAATYLSVTKISVFGALSTVVSTFCGIILLNEPFSAMLIIGAVLIIIGIREVNAHGN